MLSIIVPAYNEAKLIHKTSLTLCALMRNNQIPFEVLFVDDGSKDDTWEQICKEAKNDSCVRGASFSRNFGKESAMFAGLAESEGDCCVVIDCDLQHPPEKIVEMYDLWTQGYEIVEGVKNSRGEESSFHAIAVKCFYSLISSATEIDMRHSSDFKLLDRKAVNVLLNIPERNSFFRALSSWIGFKTIEVEYDVRAREIGSSKWSTLSLIEYAITNITSFTSLPMQIVTILGVAMFLIATVLSINSLIQKMKGVAASGFTTVIILQCFTGSIIMTSLGIIGYYIARIYEEIKGRPRYIIAKRVNKNYADK